MIVIPPSQSPSPRAYELSRQIEETIESFRRMNPSLDEGEIRVALQLAGKATRARNQMAIMILIGLVVLLGGLVFSFVRGGVDLTNLPPVTLTIIGAIAIMGALAVWRNR